MSMFCSLTEFDGLAYPMFFISVIFSFHPQSKYLYFLFQLYIHFIKTAVIFIFSCSSAWQKLITYSKMSNHFLNIQLVTECKVPVPPALTRSTWIHTNPLRWILKLDNMTTHGCICNAAQFFPLSYVSVCWPMNIWSAALPFSSLCNMLTFTLPAWPISILFIY